MQTPAPVDYVRATSLEHALSLLQEHGEEARILAGGHSLLPMMKLRIARPEVLIDINELDELRGIKVEGNELVLGAMVTHREILESPVLAEHYAVFREAEKVIADPLVRNKGTIGGSMCQADPSEDLSAVGSALKGSVVVAGPSGRRTIAMREFHEGPYETKVADGEVLVEARFPIRPGNGSAYEKVERRVGDWPVCSVGAFVVVSGGTISDCGIGLTAVGAEHFCAPEAEAFLIGKAPTDENLRAAAEMAADSCSPSSDQRGPADYKKHLANELTFRALKRAAAASQEPDMQVTITINGEQVTRDIEPRKLLVHFVREDAGLRGTHWGCDTSNCGACTLWVDGQAVKSCTMLAAQADGHEVTTVEGLEKGGDLDPVQKGFIECHGLQCGFCTPGMMMTARWLLDHNPNPSEEEIREAISGQICRCTGYKNIVAAIQWAAENPATSEVNA